MRFDDLCKVFSVVDICKIDDKNIFSYQKVCQTHKKFSVIKFRYLKKSPVNRLTTFAVSQKDFRSEQAEDNNSFDVNSYSVKVDIEFIKVTDPNESVFEYQNCKKLINQGTRERTEYAHRDTYVEFDQFDEGVYYMFVKVIWNGKSRNKEFAVNCYAPSRCIWLGDET